MTAPHERPAPKPEQAMMSPFFTLPLATASDNAIGIEPALVLPF